MTQSDPMDEFLTELSQLTKRFGLSIASCGHCDGVFLEQEPLPPGGIPGFHADDEIRATNLSWDPETREYSVRHRTPGPSPLQSGA